MFQEIRKKLDDIRKFFEKIITNFVEQLAEDYPLFGLLIIFTNMNIANVEAVRAILFIFNFVDDAVERSISAFNATTTFLDAIGIL